jgi:hypothetical protein
MEERLAALAEVAVGLAGFSSVVVVFRRRTSDGAWKPEDAFRFKLMLEAGLFAGLFALLPNAIAGLGLAGNRLWPFLSMLLLAYLVSDILRKRRQMEDLPAASLNRGLVWFTGSASFVVILIQALNIADWLVLRGPGPYVFGVTWLTAYSGLTFYRLVTAPMTVSDGQDSRAV